MLDVLNWARERAQSEPRRRSEHASDCTDGRICWRPCTAARTPTIRRGWRQFLQAFNALDEPVVFPVHPRARKVIAAAGMPARSRTSSLIDPVGYLDMVALDRRRAPGPHRLGRAAEGGVLARRAVPHAARRNRMGGNGRRGLEHVSSAPTATAIVQAVRSFAPPTRRPALYGDGQAAAQVRRSARHAVRVSSIATRDGVSGDGEPCMTSDSNSRRSTSPSSASATGARTWCATSTSSARSPRSATPIGFGRGAAAGRSTRDVGSSTTTATCSPIRRSTPWRWRRRRSRTTRWPRPRSRPARTCSSRSRWRST